MAHENLIREEHVEGSSDRTFGLVMAAAFVVVACWPLLSRAGVRWWAIAIAAVFAVLSLARPALLSGLNRQWMKLGLLLGKIVSPIALGVLFYAVLTPMGFVIRALGKDPLKLKFDPAAESYWQRRTPPGPPPDSMTNQF